MSRWKATTSSIAHEIDANSITSARSTAWAYRMLQSDPQSLNKRTNVVNLARNLQHVANESVLFSDIIDEIYPLWLKEMIHEQSKPVSAWISDDVMTRGATEGICALDTFFAIAHGQSESEVRRYMRNAQTLLDSGLGSYLSLARYYKTSADLRSMIEFKDSRRHYMPNILTGLERGFSVEQLKKLSFLFYHLGNLGDPVDLDVLVSNYGYTRINGVLKITEARRFPALDKTTLEVLLAAGFSKADEIKAYAGNLRLDASDPDVFNKLASIRSRMTTDEHGVLVQKHPDIQLLTGVLTNLLASS